MELVAIDARVSHWVNRPRLWWATFFVAKRTDEMDNIDKGIRTLVPWLPMAPVETFLDPGAVVQWGGMARRFFTFLRPAPSEVPHRAANGLETASEEAVRRWKADAHRYSLNQYETVNGVFTDGEWRPLNSRERARLHGVPDGYLAAAALTEDEACRLVGDSMAVDSLNRIFASIPEAPGAWPPMALAIEGGSVVAMRPGSEEEREAEAVRPVAGAVLGTAPELLREGELTQAQMARAMAAATHLTERAPIGRPIGLVKLGQAWEVRRAENQRPLMDHRWQLPVISEAYMDGYVAQKIAGDSGHLEWAEIPEDVTLMVVLGATAYHGALMASSKDGVVTARPSSGRAFLLAGEPSQLRFTPAEGTAEAIVIVGYQSRARKPAALVAEARRSGLYPWQPSDDPKVRHGGLPTSGIAGVEGGALGVERWRLRAAQDEDEELRPFLVVAAQERRAESGRMWRHLVPGKVTQAEVGVSAAKNFPQVYEVPRQDRKSVV
jgi:hypothetical protein